MLLVLNVNNTNTVIALYPLSGQRTGELRATWRISTRQAQTADEYGILIRSLLAMEGVDSNAIGGIVIASVVPPMDWILRQFCERYFSHKPLFIEMWNIVHDLSGIEFRSFHTKNSCPPTVSAKPSTVTKASSLLTIYLIQSLNATPCNEGVAATISV